MIRTLPLVPDAPGLVAEFALRHGGVSASPFDSLNLGLSTDDDNECVVANRRRLAEQVGAPFERWLVCGQVHGAQVRTASEELLGTGTVEVCPDRYSADAVFLPEPDMFALALSADCPLVVIQDPVERYAGVAHAGWRGTAAGVIEALVDRFEEAGARVENLRAGISPGICGRCYEVGDEVFEALKDKPGSDAARVGARHLDLRRVQRRIVESFGITVAVRTECSSCSPGFFSYRRDGARTGRCGAVVGHLKSV